MPWVNLTLIGLALILIIKREKTNKEKIKEIKAAIDQINENQDVLIAALKEQQNQLSDVLTKIINCQESTS